jgi:hypothetical protein
LKMTGFIFWRYFTFMQKKLFKTQLIIKVLILSQAEQIKEMMVEILHITASWVFSRNYSVEHMNLNNAKILCNKLCIKPMHSKFVLQIFRFGMRYLYTPSFCHLLHIVNLSTHGV